MRAVLSLMMLALYRGRARKAKVQEENIMKKLLALLLTGCMMAATLVGCGKADAVATQDADVAVEAEAEVAEEAAEEVESDLA